MVMFKPYCYIDGQNIKKTFYQTILLCLIGTVILFISLCRFDFTLKENIYFSIIPGCLFLLMLAVNRTYIIYFIKKSSLNSNFIKHILLVGTGFNAQSISSYIEKHPECGLRVTGFLTDKDKEIGKTISNNKILGKVDNINTLVFKYYTDCVLYTHDNGYERYQESLIKSCFIMGIDFATTEPEFHNKKINNKGVFSEHIGDFELKLVKFVYISPLSSFLKRVSDFILSSILIVMLLPLWVVIPIAIKLSSSGPIFFPQERIGRYGKKFILFKFRSMVVGAEEMQQSLMHLNEMDGPAFKIKEDPRQTIAGKFLRRSSLDELPQLFNVIKGDISLVGPRPAIESEVVNYSPNERKRLSLMQGITCIWQVSGRNKIKFHEWMQLDLMYIENWSLAQDFKILFRTIPAVLFKKGAA
jgi:exopolysaccharide biosynthesis polyprenyl glycosylphosphotransferase